MYINTDLCVGGPIFGSSASPTVGHKVVEALQTVPYYDETYSNYYDFWKAHKESEAPEIYLPDAGSDHASFIFYAGVPVIDTYFDPDSKKYPSLSNIGYPTYHTAFETFKLVDEIIDPNYDIMATASMINLYLVRDFADSLLLDLKITGYNKVLEDFKNDDILLSLKDKGIDPKYTDFMSKTIEDYKDSTLKWSERFNNSLSEIQSSPLLIKAINDQMMNLDKYFLLKDGIPGRSIYSHAIISPSNFNAYGSGYFPGKKLYKSHPLLKKCRISEQKGKTLLDR